MERGTIDLSLSLGGRSVVIVGTCLPWSFSAFEAVGCAKLKYFSVDTLCSSSRPLSLEKVFLRTVSSNFVSFRDESSLVDSLLSEEDPEHLTVFLESKHYLSKLSARDLLESPISQILVAGRLGDGGFRECTTVSISQSDLGGVTDYPGTFSWYPLPGNRGDPTK